MMRKKERIGLRELSRRLGVSAGHLCDLEQGRRILSDDFIEKYQATLALCRK